MDEGGKQLGSVAVAVVVALALIALATALFTDGGAIDAAIDGQITAITEAAATAVA